MAGLIGLALVGSAVAIPLTAVSATAGAAVCDRWAATTGDDGNPGTQAAPYRSLTKLAASLAPGGTGCLPLGQTYFTHDQPGGFMGGGIIGPVGGTPGNPITITSPTGGTAVIKGDLWFQAGSHDILLDGLSFQGSYLKTGAPSGEKNEHISIHGDRITLSNNDITNPRGICIGVGKAHASDPNVNDRADDVWIHHNRIHGCGMDPTITWYTGDSGAHGVYLQNTLDAVVNDNLIYDNLYRGLQLWPRNDGAHIMNNVFDDNATHVNIGSSIACSGGCQGGGFVSTNTQVYNNIFSNRVTTWEPSKNPSQVYGFFPVGSTPTQYGNSVHHNCFAAGDPTVTGYGVEDTANIVQTVAYVSQATADYTVKPTGGCTDQGPNNVRPGGATNYLPDLVVQEKAGADTIMKFSFFPDSQHPYNVTVVSGTASAADYELLTPVVPLYGTDVQVRVKSDALDEGVESFLLKLTATDGSGAIQLVTGSIIDANQASGVVNPPVKAVSSVTAVPASTTQGAASVQVAVAPATATGSVALYEGGVLVASGSVVNGAATIALPPGTSVGPHTFTVTYSGDAATLSSQSTMSMTVTTSTEPPPPPPVATTVKATAPSTPLIYGTGGPIPISLSPSTATGQVELLNGTSVVAATTVTQGAGSALLAPKALMPGGYTLTVRYGGDAGHQASSSTLVVKVVKAKARWLVTKPVKPFKLGQSGKFKIALAATGVKVTGQVQVTIAGYTKSWTVKLKDGKGVLSLPKLNSVGGKKVKLYYLGSKVVKKKRKALTIRVTR